LTVKIAFIYRSNYIALMLEALFYFSLTVGTHLLYVQLAVKIEIGDDDDHHSDVYQLKRLKKKINKKFMLAWIPTIDLYLCDTGAAFFFLNCLN